MATVYSIGYGNRSALETIDLVKRLGCVYLIDVRSSPYSRFLPEYNREAFEAQCSKASIRYVFMGDQLGGRPTSATCYDEDGKVNYEKMENDLGFTAGLKRLETALEKGLDVVVMCSELRPEQCHRSKLIGKVLSEHGCSMRHVDADGSLIDQDTVLKRITHGQADLFGASPKTIRSRGAYEKPDA